MWKGGGSYLEGRREGEVEKVGSDDMEGGSAGMVGR